MKKISKKTIFAAMIVLLLVLSNVFLGINYFIQLKKINNLQKEATARQTNGKITNFLNLFIQKVLKTDKPVSFEDRLQLENEVRDINDEEILKKWEEFTGATTEAKAQEEVKDLLEELAKKILY